MRSRINDKLKYRGVFQYLGRISGGNKRSPESVDDTFLPAKQISLIGYRASKRRTCLNEARITRRMPLDTGTDRNLSGSRGFQHFHRFARSQSGLVRRRTDQFAAADRSIREATRSHSPDLIAGVI